ncbi:RES family NAD+ phosphorylase [Sinorhizobium meliloti]|uniref:RES family NAD+ phosphorylase n=1 Tax=Rhizobium meliloti TaxID=382 RepID=UPI00398CA6FC
MSSGQIDKLKAKKICSDCVGEKYLSKEIGREGRHGKCSYCDETGKCYRLGELSERIETAFEQHYTRTSDQPDSWEYSLLTDREMDYEWYRHGEPVVHAIMNAADIPEEAAGDAQRILEEQYSDYEAQKMGEETEFADGSYYEEKGASDVDWREEWESFERSLKTEARFFSRLADAHLTSVFEGIDEMTTLDGRPLIVDAGPGTNMAALYRARAFQSNKRLEECLMRPDQQLGSPPALLASAGRMNARGISVFYGANDPYVALAEVRPPVGSQVAVARFDIIRPLRLLDLPAFSEVSSGGSVFDPEVAGRMERAMFLRSLSQRITKPVMPDDEAFEYLATQAVADFLATESSVPLDGIIFSSVQAAGEALNVVLFHKAARVEDIDLPNGTRVSASLGRETEDGWYRDYYISEEVPPVKEAPATGEPKRNLPGFEVIARTFWEDATKDWDWRQATLGINLESVEVHVIKGVTFSTEPHKVRRLRWEQRKPDF